MQFTRQGDFYQVERVMGITHSLFAICLTTESVPSPTLEALPGFCRRHGALTPSEIVNSVQESVALANSAFDTRHAVSDIRYREGDTPPESVYGVLAYKIIEHLASGGTFE